MTESLEPRAIMEQAISLARKCIGENGRGSPKVAAVVVRDGVVLGAAYRGEFEPGEHAEFTLLEKKLVDEVLAGATLYTTLEPCTRRNSPKIPCVERTVERRIAKVVIGVLDPNDDIRGRGELRLRDAGIDVGRFDSDLMAKIEEMNREFARLHTDDGRLQRTHVQMIDPADPDEVGPNGYGIGCTDDADKVEWVPTDDPDDTEEFWPLLLRRNDAVILESYNELWEKVWWNRHQVALQRLADGTDELSPAQQGGFEIVEPTLPVSRRSTAERTSDGTTSNGAS